MTTTYYNIARFRGFAKAWLNKNKDRTPFHYALERMLKATGKQQEAFEDKQEELRMEYVSTDKNGNIVYNEVTKGYAFKPEQLESLAADIKKEGEKETEVEPYIATIIPELEYEFYEAFCGFVMREKEEPKQPKHKNGNGTASDKRQAKSNPLEA